MTKAEIVAKISDKLGVDKADVQAIVENFMDEIKGSLEKGDNVYLRGSGNISKNTTITIPAHNIPSFKPAKVFVQGVKDNVKVKK